MGNQIASEVKLEHHVYYPGNVVRGTATIRFERPTPCVAARIVCRGLERAICVKEGAEHVHQDAVVHHETLTLFGHATEDQDATPVEVPAGTYTYPFEFKLPMHLPSSIHLSNWMSGGVEVKYTVSAYIRYSKDHVGEGHADFAVLAPINQKNLLESQPAMTTDAVRLTSLLTHKGTCEVTIKTERSLYAADETIKGSIRLDNTRGEIDVNNVFVTLLCVAETNVDRKLANLMYDLAGGACADPVIRAKIPCHVPAGSHLDVALTIKLPHVIQYASYPARGVHMKLRHDLLFEVAGKRIDLPINIAHCYDPQNRFAFIPLDQVTHKPEDHTHEYKYAPPADHPGSPAGLNPPATLPSQPTPAEETPQAHGTGSLSHE